MHVACVNTQLQREEGGQQPQPPTRSAGHPFPHSSPCAAGKGCWRGWKDKLNLLRDFSGALCLLPSRCATYNPKTFKLVLTRLSLPLPLCAVQNRWAHNATFGWNSTLGLRAVGPSDSLSQDGIANCCWTMLCHNLAQASHPQNSFGMYIQVPTHLYSPTSRAEYPSPPSQALYLVCSHQSWF